MAGYADSRPEPFLDTAASSSLDGLSDTERDQALNRFWLLRPYLEDGVPLARLAREKDIPLRTMRYWVGRYRKHGLSGLARAGRSDKGKRRRLSLRLQHAIEGLALKQPRVSIAAIHRATRPIAEKLGEPAPSYKIVYTIVNNLAPGLVTLAHEGTKTYSETFDLLHRTEAETPNAIWQADHTQLDIFIKNGGDDRKPWLTIVLDDYSRAVAGYALSLSAPSAIQTALALRQAIWRKSQPGWSVCGIPGILYTDHGSDFTSQHIEQVAADLKIQLVFSAVGQPRGRGKIERFFRSISQILLPRLSGYAPTGKRKAAMTLADLGKELENYFIHEYHVTPHGTTGEPPQRRWDAGGFLPQMPDSLGQLDLLLLTVPKTRRVHADGIKFSGFRYIDPTLSAYIGEQVLVRYDPSDMAEMRVFHEDRFICRAICQELAGETVALRDIVSARTRRKRELRQEIKDRVRTVDALLEVRRGGTRQREDDLERPPITAPSQPKLKRYKADE